MPSKNPNPAYSIRFTPDELDALKRRAEREDRPISEIIREALAGGLLSRPDVQVTAANETPVRVSLYRDESAGRAATFTVCEIKHSSALAEEPAST